MEGFTIVDGIVAVLIILSALLAYSRGFVRESLAIVGWIAAAVVAYLFAAQVEPLMQEIPILGDFIKDSCELSLIAAFAAVFALALVILSIFIPLFSSLVQRSALGGIDQGLGFLFGALRGALLVAVALLVYDRVITSQAVAVIDDSRTARIFAQVQDRLNDSIPQEAPGWILQRYEEFVSSCSTGATGSGDATGSSLPQVTE